MINIRYHIKVFIRVGKWKILKQPYQAVERSLTVVDPITEDTVSYKVLEAFNYE